jgi:hypothetical protein
MAVERAVPVDLLAVSSSVDERVGADLALSSRCDGSTFWCR